MLRETYESRALMPEAGERFHEGNIAYHLRKGTHYLSREDWNHFMDYLTRN